MGVLGNEGVKTLEPFGADFLETDEVGVFGLKEVEDLFLVRVGGENVKGDDFQWGARGLALVFEEGKIVVG